MRFNRLLLLPVAVLALGVVPACSGETDDNEDNDAGTSVDAGTGGEPDSGPVTFPDAGSDPGTSPAGTCPTGAIICENFSSGPEANGWVAAKENAIITAEGGRLHVLTENGHDEKVERPQEQAIARWLKKIPPFGTQLFARAHVFLTSLPGDQGQMGTVFVLFSDTETDFGGIELQVIKDQGFALDDWTTQPGQGWNRQPVGATPNMSAGRWVCLEWEVRRATASAIHGDVRVYVDGALAHAFTGEEGKIGMRPFNTFMVGYGFVHPQGPSGSETFIDNVVVSSTARVGCQ
ncbi:hypothetical protein [Pyxidicoccus xibeiensis]|uniref:hypothetical protein n=1 Tax=Pyxidicoccus xibeiensis TaxID=2906759 RepID=UPI0020A6ED0D|nr:hypothetical protein [Pyxidicoccus xibeiensis]MCP3141464.1 hypothetical protein [Pyxidicoccus xibeiensis]